MRPTRCAAALLALALLACGGNEEGSRERPSHPLLADLEPPPRNRALRVSAGAPAEADAQRPADPGPGVFALREGRRLAEVTLEGVRLEVEADRMRITPTTGAPVELRLRLPEGLGTPRAAVGDAELRVADRARPDGAQRHVSVRDAKGLVVAEVWRSEPDPLVVELGDGVVLRQERAGPPRAGSEYAEAGVRLQEGERVREIPVGKPVEIETQIGALRLFVAISQRFTPRDPAGQYPPVYILRVFAIGG